MTYVWPLWRLCGVHVASVWRLHDVRGACGVRVASVWCLHDVHVAYMWRPCGVHVASTWRLCGVRVASMWRICAVYVAYMWRLHSVHVAYTWRLCSVHVAYMWRSTRCGHCGGRLQYLNSQQLTWRVAMTTARRAAYLSWLYVTPLLGFQTRGRPSLASLLSDLQVDRLINVHSAESVPM